MDNSLQIVNTNREMQEWADKIAVATFLYVLGAEKTMFLYLLFTIGNRRFLTEFQAENLGLSRFLFQRKVITKLLQDLPLTALQSNFYPKFLQQK